ncbi:MAG: DUF4114 domain-containing protein [Nitrospinae bacterium]|nr:DUF4114 domain-containing protein [Nitrospinota bacterium]
MDRTGLRQSFISRTVTAFLLAGMALWPVPGAHAQALATGCVAGGSSSTTAGSFNASNYSLNGVGVNASGNLQLETGQSALNPSSVVVPFEQDIYSTYISEGAGYVSHFGWFLLREAEQKVNAGNPIAGPLSWASLTSAGVTLNYLYRSIKDDGASCCDGGNGILDNYYNSAGTLLGTSSGLTEAQLTTYGYSPNNDGAVDNRDMRKYMGHFVGGTEIVFFLLPNGSTATPWYSKNNWSGDTWNPSNNNKKSLVSGSTYRQLTQTLLLDQLSPESGGTTTYNSAPNPRTWSQGWIPTAPQTRLSTYHATTLSGSVANTYTYGQKYNHFIVGAPPTDPFKWVLGMEDLSGAGDADFNDLVIYIQRKTGGMAQLQSTQAMSPTDADAYITQVTFSVRDKMPTCNGKASSIRYYLSIDNGVTWVEVTSWDQIKTPDSIGATVTGWVYGTPEETWRQGTISFSELGLTGRQLLWKGEYVSEDDACKPETIEVSLSFQAAKNQQFSRSAPTSLGNVMYTATFETPATTWTDKELRGHLFSERLYDPTSTSAGYSIVQNWDAGSVLTAGSPNSRTVLYPDITVTAIAGEALATGDGVTTTFSGTLAQKPLVHSTLSITDSIETFIDKRTTELEGNLTGTGTINRFTGAYSITFNSAPSVGVPITASYQYYVTSSTMNAFNTANMTYQKLALDSSSYYDGTGFHYTYDFNSSGTASTADGTLEADADWLTQWVRGWTNGSTATTKKEWLLGAIDHSAPAVVGAPGVPGWYFGTAVTQTIKDAYDTFRCTERTRRTEAYVGARDGMLHSFYSGEFRPFFIDESLMGGTCSGTVDLEKFRDATNPNTFTSASGAKFPYYTTPTGVQITINRGYYDWKTRSGSTLSSSTSPNYGTGAETFAAVPVEQLAKLKNNKLKGEDRAFVDASPSVAFAQFSDGTWHTVLIHAEGNGGDHVTALDITNPTTPTFLWEYADPDLYRSRSSPSVGSIGRIYTSSGPKWVVFFVSGINQDPTLNPSIYMLDVETGEVLKRIFLDSAGASGLGGTPSGQPAIIDSDGNGYNDRLYIGTDKGFMYKATLPDNPNSSAGDITVCTLFNAGQPIYASPAVSNQSTIQTDGTLAYNLTVLFGTSDSPYYVDDTGQTYWFYAVSDTADKGQCASGTMLWSFQLPPGQRVYASAFATAGRVYFGTSTADTEDPCSPAVSSAGGGVGGIYALDIKTGATVYSESVGNITTSPLVDDEHLYFKSANGQLQGRGGNTFQNQVQQGGAGDVQINMWREISQQ